MGIVLVHELASIISTISSALKPNRQIRVIQSLANKFGISTWSIKRSVCDARAMGEMATARHSSAYHKAKLRRVSNQWVK